MANRMANQKTFHIKYNTNVVFQVPSPVISLSYYLLLYKYKITKCYAYQGNYQFYITFFIISFPPPPYC